MLPVLVFLGVLAARPLRPGVRRPPPPTRGRGLALLGAGAAMAAVVALAALPAISDDLSDEALSQASSGRAADLREAAEKAARAKRLNPFAVRPVFAQASILERGNQQSAVAGLLVEAVERQPDNPDTWSRLARFQILVDDSASALRSLATAASLDPARFAARLGVLSYLYDERRSASATGTPLPEKLRRARRRAAPATPAPAGPAAPAPSRRPPRRPRLSPRPPRGARRRGSRPTRRRAATRSGSRARPPRLKRRHDRPVTPAAVVTAGSIRSSAHPARR